MGLTSFWLDDEYTYGSVESYDLDSKSGLSHEEQSTRWAMESRLSVLEHEKFIEIFAPYAEAIGINTIQTHPHWEKLTIKIETLKAQKIKDEAARIINEAKAAEEKVIRDAQLAIEKEIRDKEEKARHLKENHETVVK